jgi:hypothetical protein
MQTIPAQDFAAAALHEALGALEMCNPQYGLLSLTGVPVPSSLRLSGADRVCASPFDTNLALHVLAGGRALARIDLESDAWMPLRDSLLAANQAVEVLQQRQEQDAAAKAHCLVLSAHAALPRSLVLYALPFAPAESCRLLSEHALQIVFGLEFTLLRFYDLQAHLPPREVRGRGAARTDAPSARNRWNWPC